MEKVYKVYKCKTNKERAEIIFKLIDLGYTAKSINTTGFFNEEDFKEWPYIGIINDIEIMLFDESEVKYFWITSKTKLLTPYVAPHLIRLNDTYVATIYKDHIEIDGQNIPIEKVEEVYREIQKLKKK